MPTQTEAQRKAALDAAQLSPIQQAAVVQGTGYVNPVAPITPTALTETPKPLSIPTQQISRDYSPIATSTIESLLNDFNATTPQEAASNDIQRGILDSLGVLGTQRTRQQQLEQDAGLPAQRQQLQDVLNQLQGLQKEAAAIPLQIQQEFAGRGVTAGGVAPIQTGRLRENTIKSLGLAAVGQTLQGNIQLAETTIQNALDAEFEPERQRLQTLQQLYTFNKDELQRIDKKRADNLQILLGERERILSEQRADKKEVYDIAKVAAQYGAPTDVVNRILSANDGGQATAFAGGYLQDPQALQELENAKLANVLTKVQIQKSQYELQLLQKYGGMTPAQYADYLKEERKRIQEEDDAAEKNRQQGLALQEKIDVIGAALNSKGFDSAVGTTFLSRTPSSILGKAGKAITTGLLGSTGDITDAVTGSRQQFIANVENLVSREFLDNLINVKAQGATFGALTEKEQLALTQAATKIGTWRLTDDRGQVLGYNASEADFRAELQRIQDLTRVAYEKATGNSFLPDEQSVFDQLERAQVTFNPAF